MNKEYLEFQYFTDGKNKYYPGDKIQVTEDMDIDVVASRIEFTTYKVNFFNGKKELIKTFEVREGKAAPTPTMEEIMEGMKDYTFYGWDVDVSNVTRDMDVYGIYYKVD